MGVKPPKRTDLMGRQKILKPKKMAVVAMYPQFLGSQKSVF